MHASKKFKYDTEGKADAYQLFYSWCKSNRIILNNAKILHSNSGNGLFAEEEFKISDVIFSIPKSSIFTQSSPCISKIIIKECTNVENKWLPILLSTIYEYCLKEKSHWFPYFNLTTNFDELDIPLFWSREEVESQLTCTGISSSISDDSRNIEKDFIDVVVPFITKYSQHFNDQKIDLHFYKKIVAFVMAYSFTLPDDESQSPILVPLADILNHVTNNNAKLVFGDKLLTMVAVENIKKGSEIFNTYGELSNASLLHMYGFSENLTDGKYESIELPLKMLCGKLDLENVKDEDAQILESNNKIEWINKNDVLFLLQSGIAEKNSVFNFLKNYTNKTSLHKLPDTEEESDLESDSTDDEDDILTFDEISNLELKFKDILLRLVEKVIERYPNSLDDEKSVLNACLEEIDIKIKDNNIKSIQLSKRRYFSSCVRMSQLSLLHKLKTFLNK